MTSTTVKKPSSRKSLCLFTNIIDVKPKTEKMLYCRCKIQTQGHESRYYPVDQEKKQKGHSKINDQIKSNLHAWITCHPQVVQ